MFPYLQILFSETLGRGKSLQLIKKPRKQTLNLTVSCLIVEVSFLFSSVDMPQQQDIKILLHLIKYTANKMWKENSRNHHFPALSSYKRHHYGCWQMGIWLPHQLLLNTLFLTHAVTLINWGSMIIVEKVRIGLLSVHGLVYDLFRTAYIIPLITEVTLGAS